ncbi:MAG TPA: acyl-CoA dehydrogenase family protein, partial [Thermoleophilia bacterium]|nr:acyl-CoA dehydrogenase family protein [Thermoleophilia bacterium]
ALTFDGVRVHESARLGAEGEGFSIAMKTLDGGRIGIAAQAVGITQAAFDAASRYAKERRQFGRRIADFQAIRWKLADMDKDLEAARLLTHKAACLKMNGSSATVAGARAKLFASEMARKHTGEAVQILGGYGYTKEFPVERYYRDAKITEIYEGTSEVQRIIISRASLGR